MFAGLPVAALRTFEAAARLGSFKLAAAELHVTPTAVSHQIKGLEQRLGFALFDRLARGVALTAKGRRLFESVHGSLLEMAQAIDALRPRPSEAALTVSTTHSFAALWLVPRLGRFYQAHPGYQLRLETDAQVIDLLQDARVDVAIRYGTADHPGLVQACALAERFGVYGAPQQVRAAARTRAAPPALISVHWRDSRLYEAGWRQWCRAAGLDWLRRRPVWRSYEEEHYALQAGIAGQGLVLASSVMVSDSVASGLLLPFKPAVQVEGARYVALCAPGRERHPPVRAFLAWLAGEMAGSAPAAAASSRNAV